MKTQLLYGLLAISCLILSACEKCVPANFDDRIIVTKATDKYVIAVGNKGIWVLAGRYKGPNFDGKAGVALLSGDGRVCFRIKQVIEAYPNMDKDARVHDAMVLQEKQLGRI